MRIKNLLSIVIIFLATELLFACINPFDSNMNSDPQSNRILIDSIPLQKNKNLYWFYYPDGLNDKGLTYISIEKSACDVSDVNAIVKGESLYEISAAENDTIIITSSGGFEVLKNNSGYFFKNQDAGYGKDFKWNTLRDEILITDICR